MVGKRKTNEKAPTETMDRTETKEQARAPNESKKPGSREQMGTSATGGIGEIQRTIMGGHVARIHTHTSSGPLWT